jgi:DNA-binding LytR/AlgR family response regulator
MTKTIVTQRDNAESNTSAGHYPEIVADVCLKEKINLVKERLELLSECRDAKVIFSAVQSDEGFSFDIKDHLDAPEISIIPLDNFMVKNDAVNTHHFLSSPGDDLESHKSALSIRDFQKLFLSLNNIARKRKKTRLLVQQGVVNIPLLRSDIVAIYTKNRLVFVVDHNAKKYVVDKTLTELENELDKSVFFRANRQYIININFVRSFKPHQRVKLLVHLDIFEPEEPVIISQQAAPAFKRWLENA